MLLAALAGLVVCAAAQSTSKVVKLDASTFSASVPGREPWIIEFVAPWCGHCQALIPKFEAAAKASYPRRVGFGSVDCEAHASVCESMGVDGYPTVLFFPAQGDGAGQAPRKFSGSRTAEGIRDFVTRMLRPPVTKVAFVAAVKDASGDKKRAPGVVDTYSKVSAWAAAQGREGVAFLLVPPAQSPPEAAGLAQKLGQAYADVAKQLQDAATFGESHIQELPRVADVGAYDISLERVSGLYTAFDAACAVVRSEASGKGLDAFVVTAGAGAAAGTTSMKVGGVRMRVTSIGPEGDVRSALLPWVQSMRFPTLTAIAPENFPTLANNAAGAYVALAIVNSTAVKTYRTATTGGAAMGAPPASAAFMSAIETVADREETSLPPRVRDRFLFGWLDAQLYENYIQQFNLSPADAPQLLVLDTPTKRYWHDFSVKEQEDVETFLEDIVRGVAPVQRQGAFALPQRVANVIGPTATYVLAGVLATIIVWLVYKLVIAECFKAFSAPVAPAAPLPVPAPAVVPDQVPKEPIDKQAGEAGSYHAISSTSAGADAHDARHGSHVPADGTDDDNIEADALVDSDGEATSPGGPAPAGGMRRRKARQHA